MGETTIITPNVDTTNVMDGNAEYEQQMLDKADKGLGAAPEPKLFAGKYKSEEDLQKGVLELIKMQHGGDLEAFYTAQQKNMGKKEEAKPDEIKAPPKTTIDPTIEKEEDTKEAPVVLDLNKFNQEYADTGVVSPESIAELVSFGIDEQTVSDYVEGMKALQQVNNAHAYGIVGGQPQYEAMIGFAKANLSAEEIQEFNTEVTQRDLGKREAAIKSLFTKYTESNPQFIEGGATVNAGAEGSFKTENEFKAAMKDPRYAKDASYRDTVIRKLEASNFYK